MLTALSQDFQVDLLTFGEELAAGDLAKLEPEARRSDLTGALQAVRDRYRGRAVPAVIVISDGGDTGARESGAGGAGPPVFTVGVGETAQRDREVLSVTASDASVADSLVDLSVSFVSRGFGAAPVELGVSAGATNAWDPNAAGAVGTNGGRLVDSRKISPADGSPVTEVFAVAPDRSAPTIVTVHIPPDPLEATAENNTRTLLVPPTARRHRLLMLQGAPGFEQSFLDRAWTSDPGLEVDTIVRRGENASGAATFYIRSTPGRAVGLASGFPENRPQLYGYDAVVLANVDPDSLKREQLAMLRDFVALRGGGLLALGGQSFAHAGFLGTPLEDVLPVDFRNVETEETALFGGDAAATEEAPQPLALTRDGERHPVTALGRTAEETRQRWASLPALASILPVGGPRRGAQVLIVSGARDPEKDSERDALPLVVVQRYGHGRTMVFAGDAAWRWKMLLPATDTTYNTFWRQAARWLTATAPDPIMIREVDETMAGDTVSLDVLVRDDAFNAVPDATVKMNVTLPDGEQRQPGVGLADAATGTYRAALRMDQRGVYGVTVSVQRPGRPNFAGGTARRWILVGGAERELADPRLNEDVLRRIAQASGGRYLPAREAGTLPQLLAAIPLQGPERERQDLWNNGWAFSAVVLVLAAEWILRRRWGM
jgi:hypothetical protein